MANFYSHVSKNFFDPVRAHLADRLDMHTPRMSWHTFHAGWQARRPARSPERQTAHAQAHASRRTQPSTAVLRPDSSSHACHDIQDAHRSTQTNDSNSRMLAAKHMLTDNPQSARRGASRIPTAPPPATPHPAGSHPAGHHPAGHHPRQPPSTTNAGGPRNHGSAGVAHPEGRHTLGIQRIQKKNVEDSRRNATGIAGPPSTCYQTPAGTPTVIS